MSHSAVKAACYVWRGAFGKVPSSNGNSPGAYPTKRMEQLSEKRVGSDRFVGQAAYRQLTERYRALRRSRQLLSAIDEAPIETP